MVECSCTCDLVCNCLFFFKFPYRRIPTLRAVRIYSLTDVRINKCRKTSEFSVAYTVWVRVSNSGAGRPCLVRAHSSWSLDLTQSRLFSSYARACAHAWVLDRSLASESASLDMRTRHFSREDASLHNCILSDISLVAVTFELFWEFRPEDGLKLLKRLFWLW